MDQTAYVPEQYRILVVEDDKLWADECIEELCELEELHELRMVIDYAPDTKTAEDILAHLEVRRETPFHTAVIDRMLPDRRGRLSQHAGVELARYITTAFRYTQCFIMTVKPEPESRDEAWRWGLVAYLNKEDNTPRQIAERVIQELASRRVLLLKGERLQEQENVDPLYFYGQTGEVVMEVTSQTGQWAGTVRIGADAWAATIKGTAKARPVRAGTLVRALHIDDFAIVVEPLETLPEK